jgi:hypothetical protein
LQRFNYSVVPDPLTALLAALAGAVFGSASNWFGNLNKRDNAATVALIELSASVKHIDKTLERFEAAFDSVYTTLQRHDNRITRLESNSQPQGNGKPL